MDFFLYIVTAFLFGGSILVIGVQNPIHSILILILVFLLGSILLFILQVEYFALLFTIVYIGAIVVLFLFIVMMLEIKMINISERFRDLFSYKNLILAFLLLEVLIFISLDSIEILSFISGQDEARVWEYLSETNLYTDYSKLLQRSDHLRGIGGVLFTEYKYSVLLAALLLFLSMVASIVIAMENNTVETVKAQDANFQSLRQPTLTTNSLYHF